MDYALLPPEINSGRLYAGPGSAPMIAAAQAWSTLARELRSAAAQHTATTTNIPWSGPSASAMREAGQRYTAWLTATAEQVSATGAQALAAATAFETAFAATVPPAVVTQNRVLFAELVATNILGQNTSAIMTIEAAYAQMWAQDVAAMGTYQTTIQATVSNLTNWLDETFQSFVSSGPYQMPTDLLTLLTGLWAGSTATSVINQTAATPPAQVVVTPVPPMPSAWAIPPPVLNMGGANRIGPMSVPPSWAAPPRMTAPLPRPPQGAGEPYRPPLMMSMPASGSRTAKKERSQPGPQTVRFVPTTPAGG